MSGSLQNFSIRDVSYEDLNDIARIHSESFSDRALIKLGYKAVKRYYSFLLNEFSLSKPVCAISNDGCIVGFCFAGCYSGSFSGYIKKNFLFLIGRVLVHPWLIFDTNFQELTKPVLNVVRRTFHDRITKRSSRNLHASIAKDSSLIDHWGILAIAVDPEYQRQGIGEMLMSYAEAHASTIGVKNIELSVHPENIPAVSFYEKIGWEKVQTSSKWTGLMIKRLG